MQLLLPRAAPDLPRTTTVITKANLPVTLLPIPLATVTYHPLTLPPTTTGLIFTSGHGVTAAAAHPWRGPVWCVGPATAQAATAAGFTVVGTGSGGAHAMAQLMHSVSGHWAHITTPHAHSCWHHHTPATVTTHLGYTLTHVTQLPTQIISQLAPPAQRIGMGFSPRMLSTWQGLLSRANIPLETHGVAISPAVARLAPPTWRTASTPSLTAMLTQVKAILDEQQK